MNVKFDSLTFHQINNQMTLVMAYMEMLDRKIENMNIDPAFLNHWNELKKSSISLIALLRDTVPSD